MAYVANPPLEPRLLAHALAKNWWLLLLRGICAILFGVLTFVWPGITLLTLVLLYGAYALADGALALAEAVMGGAPAPRWWLALVGLFGVAAGILTFAWPGITALVLLLFIAGWAIATGVLQIVGAIRLRKEIENEWLLIASGVLSVIFGRHCTASRSAMSAAGGAAATGIGISLSWPHIAPTAACRRAVSKSQFVHVQAAGSRCKARHFCGNDPRSRRRLV
jgi:uncharacterized membrane protein HdeD (DUF308 family)